MINIINLNLDENKKNILIFSSAVILILLIDLIFIMRPQINTLKGMNPQFTTLSRDVKAVAFDIKNKELFDKRYEAAKEKMGLMNNKILREEEVSFILDEISLISKESAVKITELKPMKENQGAVLTTNVATYYRLPIYVSANCGYHEFGVFLNNIEYSDIFMKAAEFEITQNPNNQQNHLVRLVIDTFTIDKK